MLLIAGVASLPCASLNAQTRLTREEALSYSGTPVEGTGSISQLVRKRVLDDPTTLRLYSDILLGNQSWPRGADTATMLYYLYLTRNKGYLPALLKYARPGTDGRAGTGYSVAVSGLAYLADELPARQRLETLGRDTTKPDGRFLVAYALAYVNSRETRNILRSVPRAGLPPGLQKLVEVRLATPDSVPK